MQLALYKGTRPGVPGVYNRGVRCVTRGPFSHAELVFSDGWSASSSFEDGGVRFKQITYDPAKWELISLPAELEPAARQWFRAHSGAKYDLRGNLHFVFWPVTGAADRYFCSEAIAAALGLPDPWRYCPNTLASVICILNQPAVGRHHLLEGSCP